MNVAVVGGGIVGTLTAYYLHQRGCQVTVFDQAPEPASATSHANGGQLSYSFCDAMADPLLLPKLPGILFGSDPAFKIHPTMSPAFFRWGLKFLRECSTKQRDANTLALLQLAKRSSELMLPLTQKFGDHAAFSRSGKMVLLPSKPDAETIRRLELKRELGMDLRTLTAQEAVNLEPALQHLSEPAQAAIYSPNDEAANALLFTRCLSQYLTHKGVNTRFQIEVKKLKPLANNRWQITANEEVTEYDRVVLATGDAAGKLLSPHGIKLPILGMSGYSWTFPAKETSPATSITALSKRIVFSRLGDLVRVAGFADVNLNPSHSAQRAETLRQTAAQLLPEAADYNNPIGTWWHGVRAMTPDSKPILGATKLPGLYTNLGHGMLGWTLGAATAELVAHEITKNEA